MERKALLFGLLQSLLFFASANSDSNGTSMDYCIDADMAKIMEYTETLEYSSANVSVVTDGEQENLLPFGALKTDWTRLHLLHDALPSDSILKPKFKHLFRLLLIAHEQTNQFVASSQSTKRQDTIESKTTVSIPLKTDANIQEIDKKHPILIGQEKIGITFKEFSSTISPVSSKYDKDSVDAVTTKNSSQRTIVHDTDDEITVKSNIPETNATVRLPVIIATSTSIFEMSNTDKDLDDLFASKTPILTTEKPHLFPTSGEAISNEKKNSPLTPEHAMSSATDDYSTITVAVSSMSDKKKNPVEQKSEENVSTALNTSLEVNVISSTEMIVKQGMENVSSTSFTPLGIITHSTKTILTAETSTNENLSATTNLNLVFTQSQPLSSASRENLTMSTNSKKSSSPTMSAVTRPVERNWFYGVPSSTTVSSSESTKLLNLTQREEQPSASTIKKMLLATRVTSASSFSTNITTEGIKNEVSSSSESSVQSTRKEPSSVRHAKPIGEYSSTLSSTNVYTDVTIQPITYSIEKAPIASIQDNERTKLTSLDYEKKIATSEKSNERNHEISNTTREFILTSGSSTMIPAKKTKGSTVAHSNNKTDTLKNESITERINYTGANITRTSSTTSLTPLFGSLTISTSINNYASELPTTVIAEKYTNFPSEKQSVNKKETSKDESVTKKIDNVSIYTGNHSTVGIISLFSSSTVSTSTKNYSNEKPTPAIVEKETNSPSEKQSMNKIETSKDELVTKKIDSVPIYTGKHSTAGLISAFISSTVPTTVTNYIKEPLTTVIIKKETYPSREKPPMNKTDTSEDKPVTENINYSIPSDTDTTSEENKNTSREPIYVKNYLHAGYPSNNHISRDFKHGSENVDNGKKKLESQEIILYEIGGGENTKNVWRPPIVREQPVGNNIRRFDKYPNPFERYGYQRLPSSVTTKPGVDVGSGRSVKWPFLNRTNLLRSGKRDSVNADIEKQFRSYYREGKIDPSKKSRIDENHNSKIIQCKNV